MEQNDELETAEKKRKAQVMFFAGYKISEIAKQLDLPYNTVASWKKRENWEDKAPVGRVEMAIENRLCLLILKENKTGSDFKEIDLLRRQMEGVARIKKYSYGEGNETDLNPKLKRRNQNVENRKTGDKNPISEEQKTLLITEFDKTMFDYQKMWYTAGLTNRIRTILKSRQIGATYYFAHEAFVDALKTGRNQIFLSASKKQALMFRSYITAYARRVADVELKGETILLPNGAELYFLGTNSATAQSYHGNLYFDEIFWVPKFDEMRKVASAMASQKQYRQTYFSTPTTKAHPAYAFWSGKAFNKGRAKADRVNINISHEHLMYGKLCPDRQWRQIVNIYDAERGGCNLFNIEDLKFENSEEEFNQLFMCEFMDDNLSVFKYKELENCQVCSMTEWTDYKPFEGYARPFGNREVWLGYDPAFTGDRAALALIAPPKVEGGEYRILHTQTYHSEDYEQQAKHIKHYCESYNITKITIDATGMGTGVYQEVLKFRPDAVGLSYNPKLKNEMVLKARNLIQKRSLKFDSQVIPISFMTIKRQPTRSGTKMTYVSDRSEDASHGDIAWAIMHALLNVPFGETATSSRVTISAY
ncbi:MULTISPECIES: terminase large subunit domain-containing protein [Pasteurellaceae]|uniref:Terminase family protein n=1 Tax=Pasteurella atlantica TaxID=2827233 RepID=A0AAW8CN89_9PAST|nr:terminase family protein [Pasteurella atlantica]MBR0573337.1 terminase family protein [Pasteurella atlantica]MDP8040481.1 terminase family protein [Pasteurella atlantica]MDP8041872.1 terminase family protein [Pasteurella atlantica]MDP8043939.1 terminase family protein [Pasteurella atlantica]MDP8046782.1 terminase family protein [Pasteurella atlantica]